RHVTPRVLAEARKVVPREDLFISTDIEAAQQIAQTIVDRRYDAVLAGGGDGTFVRCLSDVCAHAARRGRKPPAVGVLRLGTGNAMADALGVVARRTMADVLASARRCAPNRLTMLSVAGRLSPFAGIGLDAQILEDYGITG